MFNILVVAKVVFLNEKNKTFSQLNEIIFTLKYVSLTV